MVGFLFPQSPPPSFFSSPQVFFKAQLGRLPTSCQEARMGNGHGVAGSPLAGWQQVRHASLPAAGFPASRCSAHPTHLPSFLLHACMHVFERGGEEAGGHRTTGRQEAGSMGVCVGGEEGLRDSSSRSHENKQAHVQGESR